MKYLNRYNEGDYIPEGISWLSDESSFIILYFKTRNWKIGFRVRHPRIWKSNFPRLILFKYDRRGVETI